MANSYLESYLGLNRLCPTSLFAVFPRGLPPVRTGLTFKFHLTYGNLLGSAAGLVTLFGSAILPQTGGSKAGKPDPTRAWPFFCFYAKQLASQAKPCHACFRPLSIYSSSNRSTPLYSLGCHLFLTLSRWPATEQDTFLVLQRCTVRWIA